MRALFLPITLLLAALAAQASAAGVYTSVTARSAAACARLCADDGLCVAWNFTTENACEMRATAPTSFGPTSGVSARAPEALRQSFANHVSPPQPQASATPVAATPEAPFAAVIADDEDDEDDGELLGGLNEHSAAIRPRLGD